ncbi:MAG TPA: carbohydrate ABC transporter permease [Gaiellaceae bacterium]|nr:carbohydrate ABC transporter permease [Gaiellaceae bacterium]
MACVIAFLLLIELLPIVWLVLQSFKQDSEFSLHPVWALPKGFYWENWRLAWSTGHIGTYFKNSVLATFPALFFMIVLGLAAAFSLEVMKWRGRNGVLFVFVAGLLIPLQMVLLPLFTVYFHVHLINSLWSLIITYTAFGLPLTIFLMTGYFRAVPREVLEAATLDGASIYSAFARIVLPMVSNAILTVALVQFFFIWNDLLLSLTFISDDSKRTIQTGLLNFTGQYGQVQWGPTFAAVSMTVLPTLLLYLGLNQRVMRGLTSGSLKG